MAVIQGIVNGLLIRGCNVLLSRRSLHRKTYPNCWSFPGGHVEIGESLDEALVREVREEVGVTPLSFQELGRLAEPAPRTNGNVVYHFYAVRTWTGGEPRIVGDEHSEIRWFDIDAACALSDLALAEYEVILRKLT